MELDLVILASFARHTRQSVGDITQRLTQAGIKTSADRVALALVDLKIRLENEAYPFTIQEAGLVWELEGKDPASKVLITGRAMPISEPLEELDLEVLAVVTFAGRGISGHRIEKCLARDPAKSLEKLARLQLVYAIPKAVGKAWLPAEGMLRRFGYGTPEEIPGFREYQAFLEGKKAGGDTLMKQAEEFAKKVKPRKARAARTKL